MSGRTSGRGATTIDREEQSGDLRLNLLSPGPVTAWSSTALPVGIAESDLTTGHPCVPSYT